MTSSCLLRAVGTRQRAISDDLWNLDDLADEPGHVLSVAFAYPGREAGRHADREDTVASGIVARVPANVNLNVA